MHFENYMIVADGERINIWPKWLTSIFEIAIGDMRKPSRIVLEKSRVQQKHEYERENGAHCVSESW